MLLSLIHFLVFGNHLLLWHSYFPVPEKSMHHGQEILEEYSQVPEECSILLDGFCLFFHYFCFRDSGRSWWRLYKSWFIFLLGNIESHKKWKNVRQVWRWRISIFWMYFIYHGSPSPLHFLWDRSYEAFSNGLFAIASCQLGIREGLLVLLWISKRKILLWHFSFISLNVILVLRLRHGVKD